MPDLRVSVTLRGVPEEQLSAVTEALDSVIGKTAGGFDNAGIEIKAVELHHEEDDREPESRERHAGPEAEGPEAGPGADDHEGVDGRVAGAPGTGVVGGSVGGDAPGEGSRHE